MNSNQRYVLLVASSVLVLPLGACNPASLISIPPVELNTAGAGLSNFSGLEAGPPKRLQGSFSAPDAQGFRLVGGIEIRSESVTLTPADPADQKGSLAAQLSFDIPTCLAVCAAAQVDAESCVTVCENRQIQITIWVGSVEAIELDCEDGDQYTYLIALDTDGAVESVTPSSVTFQSATVTLMNGGAGSEFGVCVEVISPASGDVLLDSIRINLGIG